MSKKKPKSPVKLPSGSTAKVTPQASESSGDERLANARWWREAVESVVVAIVLALLFRTFEAEAFVIPTGSMAPTLQGRHKDIACEECGYRYRAGASLDNEQSDRGPVTMTMCPICRYTMRLELQRNLDHDSFTGDRILVNKFAYQFGEPERWDPIVFKYPGNAKQNYIKRLIGLPGETIRIKGGDVFVRDKDGGDFAIARKPPHKLWRMLQVVHDTDYPSPRLIEAGWPSPWQAVPPSGESAAASGWTESGDRTTYTLNQEASDAESWLRYRHLTPTFDDWEDIKHDELPRGLHERPGQLITDFYAYNACVHEFDTRYNYGDSGVADVQQRTAGSHWVGDLAIECSVRIVSNSGQLLLDLVEGGQHFKCAIDVSDGTATLSIDGGRVAFNHVDGGDAVTALTQKTRVTGPGKYRLRFANVDDQLLLWVNNKLVRFDVPEGDVPGAYAPPDVVRPKWSPDDPGDLYPAGIGGKGIDMVVSRLAVLRDVYYIATDNSGQITDYKANGRLNLSVDELQRILSTPSTWQSDPLFEERRYVDFKLEEDQFFPMGDNSPQSKDARLWHSPGPYPPEVHSYVHRDLLTGKAFLIYWPHTWYAGTRKLPIIPNFRRMKLIR